MLESYSDSDVSLHEQSLELHRDLALALVLGSQLVVFELRRVQQLELVMCDRDNEWRAATTRDSVRVTI